MTGPSEAAGVQAAGLTAAQGEWWMAAQGRYRWHGGDGVRAPQ